VLEKMKVSTHTQNRELAKGQVLRQDQHVFSIVAGIPAYNEERTIAEVVLKAGCHVGKVLVCDDGSKDMTQRIARKNGAHVVEHKRNMGYGATLQTIFRKAMDLGADVLVVFDGDGQHDPDEIPELVKPILKGKADVVIGSRFVNGAERSIPLYREIGILFITFLMRILSGYAISDAQSGFRAFNRKALRELKMTEFGWGSSVEVFFRAHDAGLKIVEVPVDCSYEDYPRASKRDPLRQGISIVASIFSHVVREGVHL
jgi:glycosyltransferase involved in cell wall biosynthesis